MDFKNYYIYEDTRVLRSISNSRGVGGVFSKFKTLLKKAYFECQYLKTHTKVSPSKFSNITFAILPYFQGKNLKVNGYPEYFGIYCS